MSFKRIDLRVSRSVTGLVLTESIQCVNHLYLRSLGSKGDFSTNDGKVNYINIYLTSIIGENGRIGQVSNFLDYYTYFDFNEFNSINDNEAKRLFILNNLHNAFLEICKLFSWDREQFEAAYQTCIDKKIIFDGFFRDKLFISPNKSIFMGLYFIEDIGSYDIYEILFDKQKKEIARRKCYHDRGMVFVIGWASWEGNNEMFYYKFKGPTKTFECNINELLEGKQYNLDMKSSDFFK